MAPILINAAASLASDLVDTISEKMAASSAASGTAANSTPATGPASFASALAAAQQTPAARAAALADQQAALTSSLMAKPEITSALASVNPSQSAQLEISSTGTVSVRGANGIAKTVNVSDDTRAMVTQLYGMRQPGVMPGQNTPALVLAVDPARIMPPSWSTLPARG